MSCNFSNIKDHLKIFEIWNIVRTKLMYMNFQVFHVICSKVIDLFMGIMFFWSPGISYFTLLKHGPLPS